ncbi:MAG: hypothetical protein ACXWWG_00515 [Nitrospira sp.]
MNIAKIRVTGTAATELLVPVASISSAHRPDPKKPALVFVDGIPQGFELVRIIEVENLP